MNWRRPALWLLVIVGSAAWTAPAASQAAKKKLDVTLLTCGQKVIVDDQSCRAGEVLEVTGSCLNAEPADGMRAKGLQYNCTKRK